MRGFTRLCARELAQLVSASNLRQNFALQLVFHSSTGSLARYNKIQLTPGQSEGTYSCGNSQTLQHDLKDVMGFDGFVVSDWCDTQHASHTFQCNPSHFHFTDAPTRSQICNGGRWGCGYQGATHSMLHTCSNTIQQSPIHQCSNTISNLQCGAMVLCFLINQGATHSMSVAAGLDIEMPGARCNWLLRMMVPEDFELFGGLNAACTHLSTTNLVSAIGNDELELAKLDDSVLRILSALFSIGEFVSCECPFGDLTSSVASFERVRCGLLWRYAGRTKSKFTRRWACNQCGTSRDRGISRCCWDGVVEE